MQRIYVSLLGLGVRANAPFFFALPAPQRSDLAGFLPCNTMLTCVTRRVLA